MGTGPGAGKQRGVPGFRVQVEKRDGQFVLTGGLGGDVTATVSTGTDGSVRSFNPSIDIYQIPESGMAVQASWGGTVYAVGQRPELIPRACTPPLRPHMG